MPKKPEDQDYIDLSHYKDLFSKEFQMSILEKMLAGKKTKEIAAELKKSLSSVKYFRSKIHHMFGTSSIAELKKVFTKKK